MQDIANSEYVLTPEGLGYLEQDGSPEAQVFRAIPAEGISMADLKARLGKIGDIGFRQAMQQKWIGIDKSSGQPMLTKKVDDIEDKTLLILKSIHEHADSVEPNEFQQVSKRKLVSQNKWVTYMISKGPKFTLQRKKQATDLTAEMIAKGTWKEEEFKEYNFDAMGRLPDGGYLHPLMKVRTQFRKIFTNMGFEEMPTNNYVESSFWNFDALFQPQQHPARDAHDTFFLTRTLLLLHV